MNELSSKILSLLWYGPYIIDKNPKIQRFLSCFPISFKDKIEFGNLKTLEEVIRKANFCYEQSKNKRDVIPNWKNKRTSNFEHIRKGFNPNKSLRNNSWKFSKNNYQGTYFKGTKQQNIIEPQGRDMPNNHVKNNQQKEIMKCWEFQGTQYPK